MSKKGEMNSSIKEPGRTQPRVVDADLDYAMCLQGEPLGNVRNSPQCLSDRAHSGNCPDPVGLLDNVLLRS